MSARIRPVAEPDWKPITAIFNHFIRDSFAAYFDQDIDESFFRQHHERSPHFPFVVAEVQGRVVGFAYLSPFHPASTMRHTATITYFILPEHTGRGIGARFLEHLLKAAGPLGITNLLAHVSSLNPGSIRFHLHHGFTECGRFVHVGVKAGQSFDMVWLQKQPVGSRARGARSDPRRDSG